MKGKYRIVIENKKIKYDFEIKRNLTIIKGDSATGKTTLVDMVSEYYENGLDSGIQLQCDRCCAVLEGRNWKALLESFQNSILFIDEGNDFVSTTEFAAAIQKTNNYYVIVTREGLATLPYSVTEIYGIRDSGKYGTLRQTYNEMYHIYSDMSNEKEISPTMILTEDSNSGFEFFERMSKGNQIECKTAQGKSNMFREVKNLHGEEILIIADGAAFGSEMERMIALLKTKQSMHLFLPESFEWMILQSDAVKDNEVKQILEAIYDYVESSEYISWERYFTKLLIEKTKDTYLAYSKNTLNDAYTYGNVRDSILKQIKGVRFS